TAIEWPDDELAVFATVKGPLFAVGDEELLEYRLADDARPRPLHPFRRLADVPDRLAPIDAALELLGRLHRERNRRPIAETVHRLLDATRAHAMFVLRPSGEQALANVLHVAEQARTYESAGGISFRGFVERLLEEAGARRASEAPILEEGSEGVRLMTVHRAKGLEFPVVILADMTADIARRQASRVVDSVRERCAVRIAGWAPAELTDHQELEVDRDRAEGVRLAYVAATRARDLLVVPALGDGPWGEQTDESLGGWIAPLNGAIYPPPDAQRRAEIAPGCPRFGRDSVLDRPMDPEGDVSVQPGLHRIAEREVVWWDPGALELSVEARQGIRREELLSREVDESVVQEGVARYRDWERTRGEAIATAARPSVQPLTARAWSARRLEQAGPAWANGIAVEEIARERGRPKGPRFGALVHAVLAITPLDADDERVAGITEVQGRVLGATPEEVKAARRVARRVLEHPLLDRARDAQVRNACRRETPLTMSTPEGELVEGVLDLAFEERDGWTVVDFKSDSELDEALATYRAQVQAYVEMLAKATGAKAKGVLLRV
ncbi:MAG: PD-(D/E)XK nuclease family protein, partial [Gemmatimonadetes bacterium]|nr:PD-(D/E)XK nuclease family protein [Gemmatimonadota bacterium]